MGLPTVQNLSLTYNTVGGVFEIAGRGLHTGAQTHIRVLPATAVEGRYFVRTDLSKQPRIKGLVEFVGQTTLSTELTNGGASVRTVEHLLASLTFMGVDSARIEVDGPELPLLDGSALPWVEAITSVGVVPVLANPYQEDRRGGTPITPVAVPLVVQDGDAFVAALPAPSLRFTYGIEFEVAAIGKQWHSWTPATESFSAEIAPARTFTLARYVEQMLKAGLIKGGSLESALVCDETGWLNPPLRFANEPVRHKILDLVGDLSLLGKIPCAHYVAYKASHKLHIQLAKLLAVNAGNYHVLPSDMPKTEV